MMKTSPVDEVYSKLLDFY